MAHPFGSPSLSRNPYSGAAEFEGSRNFGGNRVFLVAIHGGLLPPIPHERNPMQRMRVVVLPPTSPMSLTHQICCQACFGVLSRRCHPHCRCLRRNDYNRGPCEARSCAIRKGACMKRSGSKFALSINWSRDLVVKF